MSPKLRKRHRLVWTILAILLPVLFLLAIWSIPQPVVQETLYQSPSTETIQTND